MSATAVRQVDDALLSALQRHGSGSSGFLTLNDGNRYFGLPGVDGYVAHRPVGRRAWVQLAGPVAAPEDRERLWRAFLAAGREQGRRVIAVQLEPADARLAARLGCSVNQFGASYSIDLTRFTLRGNRFVKTRNMVARSRRSGTVIVEVDAEHSTQPALTQALARIDSEWLRDKGRHVRELRFMVGQRGGPYAGSRRLVVALIGGEPVAYVSFSPVFGQRPGWLYDLTRRRPDVPPGVVEHLLVETAERMAEEGAAWLHLGLTPFVGLDPEHELAGAGSPALSRLVGWIAGHGDWIYPSAGQLAFKKKWQPHLVTPEYLAVSDTPRLRDAMSLARATGVLGGAA